MRFQSMAQTVTSLFTLILAFPQGSLADIPNTNSLSVQFENNPFEASADYAAPRPLLFESEKMEVSGGRIRVIKNIRADYSIQCIFPMKEMESLKKYSIGEQIPVRAKLNAYSDQPLRLVTLDCLVDSSIRTGPSIGDVSNCLDKPNRKCIDEVFKVSGLTDFSNVYATACSNFASLRSGSSHWKDIWTTSVYSYAPGGSTPGGGLANEELRVGGWGDLYYSLISFDIKTLPKSSKNAFLVLYSLKTSGSETPMSVERILDPWGWAEGDRLWWKDRPRSVRHSTSSAPRRNSWYVLDISDIYNGWAANSFPNHGLLLKPTSNDNNWNVFVSSRGADKQKTPGLIVCN